MAWLSPAVDELATLAFYAFAAKRFRPHERKAYVKLVTEADMETEGSG